MKKSVLICVIVAAIALAGVICGIVFIIPGMLVLPSEGLEFILNDDGTSYSVTGIGTCTDNDIVIPGEYEGKPVTKIGPYAFASYDYDVGQPLHSSITSVRIPSSVYGIGEKAFWSCDSLVRVTFEKDSSLQSIGDCAFLYCELLDSIAIPNTVTSIGDYAFQYCTSLKSVTFEDGINITSINDGAFSFCGVLENIILPKTVTSIGSGAFSGCTSLRSIVIPEAVTMIGDVAFSECTQLKSIVIPQLVSKIGDGMFSRCVSLSSITIPAAVTNIGNSSFLRCESLYHINYEGTVEQWNAISKEYTWNANTGSYSISCNDGNIDKKGNIRYYK